MDNKNVGLLVPVQKAASVLGISKTDVIGLVGVGMLNIISIGDKKFITKPSLEAMINGLTNSGEVDDGYPADNALYLSYSDESEDNDMAYKGYISKLKDGRHMVQIKLGTKPNGRPDFESKGFRDPLEAQEYLDRRLVELNSGLQQNVVQANFNVPYNVLQQEPTLPRMSMNFEEYATSLLNRGVKKAGPRTKEGYRSALKPVLEHIGKMNIADIDKDRLMEMFTDLSFKYLKSSLEKSFIITKIIFEEAFEAGYISKNPFLKMSKPASQRKDNDEREAFSDEEVDLILAKAKEYPNQVLYTMLAVFESTGMRPGELRVLMWEDLNLDEKTIYIHQAAKKSYEKIKDIRIGPKSSEYVGKTKSKYGIRKLKLSPVAIKALKEWRKTLDGMPKAMRESKYIFPSQSGGFTTESSFSCLMKRFIKRAQIEDIGFMPYRFRHTFCTRLALMNTPMVVTQRLMGDNTLDVISKIYTHVKEKYALEYSDQIFELQADRYDKLMKI